MDSLDWHSRPFAALLRLAWPIAVSMVSFSIMTVVDTFLVGHIGTAELAGVGLGGTTAFVLLCFSMGLLQGAKTLVSQALGAGRKDRVLSYVGVALAAAAGLGLVTLVLGELLSLGVGTMAASEHAAAAARTYLRIRALAAPIVLVQVALREVRQAQGDARSPMVATVAANALNIGLAVLFIFVFHWGVAGAALATIFAHAVEAGVLVAVQRRAGGFGLRAFDRGHVRELVHIGMPTALQFMLEVGSFATLTLAVSTFSETDMAAHQIALQLVHFSFLPCVAAGEAAAVLSGHAVGANRDDLVTQISRRATLLAASYAALCSLVMLFFGRTLVEQFTHETAVAALSARLLLVAACFGVIDAANIVTRSVLRGTGDVRFAAFFGVVIAWCSTPVCAWGLGHGLGLGAFGGWLGITLEVTVSAVVLGLRLERHGWDPAARAARARLLASAQSPEVASEGSVFVTTAESLEV